MRRLVFPLPRSPAELRERRAELEHEIALAVRRGCTQQDLAAVLFVLGEVERRLDRAADRGEPAPAVARRQQIAAERRPAIGNGR